MLISSVVLVVLTLIKTCTKHVVINISPTRDDNQKALLLVVVVVVKEATVKRLKVVKSVKHAVTAIVITSTQQHIILATTQVSDNLLDDSYMNKKMKRDKNKKTKQ